MLIDMYMYNIVIYLLIYLFIDRFIYLGHHAKE